MDFIGLAVFPELLERTKEIALGAYTNQDVSIAMLLKEINSKYYLSSQLPADVFFQFTEADHKTSNMCFDGIRMKPFFFDTGISFGGVSLFLEDNGVGFNFTVAFETDRYREETITRIMVSYKRILEEIVKNPEQALTNFLWDPAQP